MAPIYTFVFLNAHGERDGAMEASCPDDFVALEQARARAEGRTVEIWTGDQRLTRVKPDGEAALGAINRSRGSRHGARG